MNRPGFRPWNDTPEREADAAEALAAHERDEAARVEETVRRNNAEQERANTEAMLAAARLLLAEVVGLERTPVTHEQLCYRLRIHEEIVGSKGDPDGTIAETRRGLSLLIGSARDNQAGARQTIREAQSTGKKFLGIRYRPVDGRDRFDDHDPHDHRRRCFVEKRLSLTSVLAGLKKERRDAGR